MSKMLLLRQILALVVLGPLHGEMAHAASSSSAPGPSTDAANAIVPGPVFQEIDSALANPSLAAALVSQYDDKDLISKLRGAIADPSLQDVIQSRTGDPEFMSSMYNKAAKLGLMSGSAAVVSATNQTSIDYISVHSSGGGGGGGANGNIGSLRPSGLSSTPTLVSDVILNRTRPIHLCKILQFKSLSPLPFLYTRRLFM
ncbi:hypothetical protein H4219_003285 [Mycoemilia scoparia]|uniref:Uncharacterized protein n=1 Tax=Mycoemilia scoparia TaxID=417184 RepID=A0A9W7ZW22_9FUNG|nr:hypothetical protein H4219_003285 [Mycoemilia scoparia]